MFSFSGQNTLCPEKLKIWNICNFVTFLGMFYALINYPYVTKNELIWAWPKFMPLGYDNQQNNFLVSTDILSTVTLSTTQNLSMIPQLHIQEERHAQHFSTPTLDKAKMPVGVLFADEMTWCPIDTVANVVVICLLLNNSIFFLCASKPSSLFCKSWKDAW